MKKIMSLTKEQEALLPVYRDKWLEIGLSTKPSDKPAGEDAIRHAYITAGLKPPKLIIWSKSPLSGWLIVCTLRAIESKKINWASVGDSVRASVRDSVGDSVRASVGDSVGDSVWDSVRASVWASVGDSVGDSVRNWSWSECGYGQHDAYWLGFYEYLLEVCRIDACKKLLPLMDLAKNGNWFYPYKDICVVSEKPTICKLENKVIHADGGPAVAYGDGFSVWALHGVRVSQEIAETPADKLDPKLVVKEQNAQVRAEIVKKIGIERVLKSLKAKKLDKWKEYELVSLNLGDGRNRPYLKMHNRSVEMIHVEGVPPEIKTVKEALAWRNNMTKYIEPKQLT